MEFTSRELNKLELAKKKKYVTWKQLKEPDEEIKEDKGNYDSYSQIQKPFLKDFKTADTILSLNEKIYNAGAPLTGARANMIRDINTCHKNLIIRERNPDDKRSYLYKINY
mgnify:CR=1 FL=1